MTVNGCFKEGKKDWPCKDKGENGVKYCIVVKRRENNIRCKNNGQENNKRQIEEKRGMNGFSFCFMYFINNVLIIFKKHGEDKKHVNNTDASKFIWVGDKTFENTYKTLWVRRI